MRTKISLAGLLCLVLVFSLAALAGTTVACGTPDCDPHPTEPSPTEDPHPSETPPPPPPGAEGCTPGFWKNHLELWGVSPSADFDATFGVDLFNPNITLQQAVNLGGGGKNKLARHGTAALLNALSGFYPLSVPQVIAAVQAGDADALAAANELGCPLD